MAQMEQHILVPAGELKTEVDEAKRMVSVTYATDSPPRIVAWRKVFGCAQLPAGATKDAVRYLPQVSEELDTPNLDDQPWPLGDRDATTVLPRAKKKALDGLLEAAFDGTSTVAKPGASSW